MYVGDKHHKMILAPKTSTGLFRIRVKGSEYEIDQSQLKKLADVVKIKTIVNTFLISKGFQIDIYYNPPVIMCWIGSISEPIPNEWWITE